MYEVTLEETWDLFAPYLDGARTGIVCVASAARLGDAARSALEKSAAWALLKKLPRFGER